VSERIERPVGGPDNTATLSAPVYSALDGYRLLTLQLAATVDDLRQQLANTAGKWKI